MSGTSTIKCDECFVPGSTTQISEKCYYCANKFCVKCYNEMNIVPIYKKCFKIKNCFDCYKRYYPENSTKERTRFRLYAKATTHATTAKEQADATQKVITNNLAMLKDPTFTDFSFTFGDKVKKEIKVHKSILGTASPVFMKMFTTDFEESRTNTCKIDDIDSSTFEHLLRFIYGGVLPDNFEDMIGNISMKLYDAANYYEIRELKEICHRKMLVVLNVLNAIELYRRAWIYELEDVKTEAWKIIKLNILKVTDQLQNEPLPPDDVDKMLAQRRQEKLFWGLYLSR